MDGISSLGSLNIAPIAASNAGANDQMAVLAMKNALNVQKTAGAAAVQLIASAGNLGKSIDIRA